MTIDHHKPYPDIGTLAAEMDAARAAGNEALRAELNVKYERSQFHGYGWGTHIPLLASVIATAREGAVLEIGVGRCSSPMLVELCRAMGRVLVGLDSEQAWLDEIATLDYPHLERMASWGELPAWLDKMRLASSVPAVSPWAVIFIDHGPGEARLPVLKACRGHAEFIVCHDTFNPGHLIGFDDELATYPYRSDYTLMASSTSVVSDVRPYAGKR
jgi:hypothetical protein